MGVIVISLSCSPKMMSYPMTYKDSWHNINDGQHSDFSFKKQTNNCCKNTLQEIYTLNKNFCVPYSIAKYRHNVVHQGSRMYSSCITETLYPLNNNSLPPLALGNHHSALCFYPSDYSTYVLYMESWSVCHSVLGLFHLP